MNRRHTEIVFLSLITFLSWPPTFPRCNAEIESADSHAGALLCSPTVPLVAPSDEYQLGEYWVPGRVGNRDFYFAEQGPYQRMKDESVTALQQVGLINRLIPGHWNYDINKFAPETRRELTGVWKRLVESYLQNRWPVHTIQYCTAKGNPAPTPSETPEPAGSCDRRGE